MSYVVLALKWRPQSFDEIAGQEAIAQTLKNAIRTERTAHAYLFTGPRGVGKTTAARILAKALNCAEGPTPDPCNRCDSCEEIRGGRSLDVIEIDGASNRGIDDIRELREKVRYAPASSRTKVYIIDEVHMLTTDAFNALLKTLEEPPSHVIFVLATTEPLKLPATILSRCQRYDFSRLRVRDAVARMRTICESEKVEITEDALSLLGRRAEGSMRDALTLLDQVIASGKAPIDGPDVAEVLGIAGRELYFSLSEALLAQDPQKALSTIGSAYAEGQNLQEVADELVSHLRNLLVASAGESLADLIDATDVERERYVEQASRAKPADLIRQLHIAIEAAGRMRRSPFPRVLLELAAAEIALLPRSADLVEWLGKLPEGDDPPADASAQGPASSAPTRAPAAPASSGGSRPASDPTLGLAGVSAVEPPPVSDAGPWTSVVERIRARRPALAASLAGSFVAGEEGGYLLIRFAEGTGSFGAGALERPENRAILQEAIRQIYGRPVGWRAAPAPASAQRPATATSPAGPEAGAKPPAVGQAPPSPGSRANLADIQRIARRLDGEILGPS